MRFSHHFLCVCAICSFVRSLCRLCKFDAARNIRHTIEAIVLHFSTFSVSVTLVYSCIYRHTMHSTVCVVSRRVLFFGRPLRLQLIIVSFY